MSDKLEFIVLITNFSCVGRETAGALQGVYKQHTKRKFDIFGKQ